MRVALMLIWSAVACDRFLAAESVVRESLTGRHVRTFEAPRCVVHRAPLKPFTCEGVPLFFNAAQPARVFDPNPVAALNDPSLMDENDSPAAVPEHAYGNATVDLLGPHVRVVDRQAPTTAQPDPNAPLVFDRGDDRFEPVNAAFHIDRTQRYLQSLGYTGPRQLVPYAIEVDALAFSGGDASFFLPSFTQPGRGTLFYGSGGTDDAEDADLVVHEYGHAILEWIAPGTFGGTFSSESRALSEGFGDYLAFSAHYEQRVASGRDPFCFADWDARCWTDAPSEACAYPAGADCLRRLDSPRTMADYQRGDTSGVEHRNGQIWSSALREIFLKLGRRSTDILAIESLFDAPPHPTFAVMGRRMIETDRVLSGGVHRDAICAAFVSRGIGVSCDGAPRGELTHMQSFDRALPIPENDPAGSVSRITVDDARTIERIGVRVDIDHPSRGDLRIELVAPDGTRVLLQNVSFELTADIHATFGFDAAAAESLDLLRGRPAAGTWELHVSDQRARDVGTLRSWSLVLQFAGDEPKAARPRAQTSQMIPVVAHVASFASDLRIANVTASAQTATLIFTRSGEDGTVSFSAIDVRLAAGQTVAFDDVLQSALFASGSGSLEVLGDVIVMSRTYAPYAGGGTVGQQIPPAYHRTALGATPLYAAPLGDGRSRFNLGLTELVGERVLVQVRRFGGATTTHELLPFSHTQLPYEPLLAEIGVIEGNGRVAAYVSQIDSGSGDPMYIPAELPEGVVRIAPVVSGGGVNGAQWQTDLWFGAIRHNPLFLVFPFYLVEGGTVAPREPPLGTILAVPDAFADTLRGAGRPLGAVEFDAGLKYIPGLRVRNGAMSQFITAGFPTHLPQHLFVESNDAYRTNIGVVSSHPDLLLVEIWVYDAAGIIVQSHSSILSNGILQIAVTARVTGGRAEVRVHGSGGLAYASIVDNASGDATFVPGQ